MSWGVLSSEGLESQSHQSKPIVFKHDSTWFQIQIKVVLFIFQ